MELTGDVSLLPRNRAKGASKGTWQRVCSRQFFWPKPWISQLRFLSGGEHQNV